MSMQKSAIAFLLLFTSLISRSQSDNELIITAFWETYDSVAWEVTAVEETMENGKNEVEKTTYEAILTILDSTESSYKIRWEFKNLQFHYDIDPLIKKVLNSLPELPLIYETNEFGKLETLKNWKYLKSEMGKAMDKLRTNFPELPDTTSAKIKAGIMSEYESEEQIKFQMKDLRVFHYFYGEALPIKKPLIRTMYFSNSYLQDFLPGDETITIESVDEETQVAHIKSVGKLSRERNLELVEDYLEKKYKILNKTPPNIKDVPLFGTSIINDIEIDLSTGYIIRCNFIKLVEFEEGFYRNELVFKLKN